jgi:hypothetical protein
MYEGTTLKSVSNTTSGVIAFFSLTLVAVYAQAQDTDLRSYRLGSTASWSEAVSVGVKELALSSPATPDEMDALIGEAKNIAARFGISVYRETDLLVALLAHEAHSEVRLTRY